MLVDFFQFHYEALLSVALEHGLVTFITLCIQKLGTGSKLNNLFKFISWHEEIRAMKYSKPVVIIIICLAVSVIPSHENLTLSLSSSWETSSCNQSFTSIILHNTGFSMYPLLP